jgi:hypothetical protein
VSLEITDCSTPIAEIQCLLASLQFLQPGEQWSIAHPVLRQWLPEYEEFGWYSADYGDLVALAEALRGIHRQAVIESLQRAK